MPLEFKDFSQEVSAGTGKIEEGLKAVRTAADAADSSSGNLSNTQANAIRVADGYSKAMGGVGRELSDVAKSGFELSRGLSAAESGVRTFGSSLSTIKGGAADASAGLSGMRDVTQEVNKAMTALGMQKVSPKFDADSAKKAAKVIGKTTDEVERAQKVISKQFSMKLDVA